MPSEQIGSPGARADEPRAEGRRPQRNDDEAERSPLAQASPGAAADRKRTGGEPQPEESVTERLDGTSPGLTAEAETDSS